MSTDIPDAVKAFVAAHVGSLVQLELLLLLHATASRAWTVADAVSELRLSQEAVEPRLERMYAEGLLIRQDGSPPRYRFGPRDPQQVGVVDALALAYKERRVALTTLIYTSPGSHVIAFADAFKFRKDKH